MFSSHEARFLFFVVAIFNIIGSLGRILMWRPDTLYSMERYMGGPVGYMLTAGLSIAFFSIVLWDNFKVIYRQPKLRNSVTVGVTVAMAITAFITEQFIVIAITATFVRIYG